MVICFIGDSLTQGIGDSQALGWAGRLSQACFAADPAGYGAKTVCNLGVRTDGAPNIAERWRAETDRRRRKGEDMAFVFSFGAADIQRGNSEAETLAAARKILGEAVTLGRTLYIAPPPAQKPEFSARIRDVGRKICAVCGELGVPTFDFYEPLAAVPSYMASLSRDGIHPDAAGYARMADLLRGWPPMRGLLGL